MIVRGCFDNYAALGGAAADAVGGNADPEATVIVTPVCVSPRTLPASPSAPTLSAAD